MPQTSQKEEGVRRGRPASPCLLIEPGFLALALVGSLAGHRADLLLQRLGVVLVPPDEESGAQRPDDPFPVVALLVVHAVSPRCQAVAIAHARSRL